MTKLYIAGQMTGVKYYNFPAFDAAAERIKAMGYTPINPAERDRKRGFDAMKLPEDYNWNLQPIGLDMYDVARQDIKALLFEADGIYMLTGWEKSQHAPLEKKIAEWIGLHGFNQQGRHPEPDQ